MAAPRYAVFVATGLTFAFIDETISTRKGRWEYAPAMPRIFGVGLTPLLELPVTGIVALALVFFGQGNCLLL